MTSADVIINGRPIGPSHPPYLVAELSGNHGGELNRMLSGVNAAAAAGAEAVKIQTYTPETITIDHDGPGFRIEDGLWAGRTLFDLYREAHTPWEWHEPIFDKARKLGITLFSSPFDPTAVDLLESLDAPAYKIASFEIVDLPLIARVARTGKPVIVSTGMAADAEIADAVDIIRGQGNEQIVLLHCVSAYPAPASESCLSRIPELAARHGANIGLSDHTIGENIPIAAVALGATLIEKHFIEDANLDTPDAAFSADPATFRRMAEACRIAWGAIGTAGEGRAASERANRKLRRSLYVIRDVPANTVLTEADIRSIRPGYGLPPKHLSEALGRRTSRALKRGEPLRWDMMEDPSEP